MRREFSGRHMAAVLVAGFGVVVAVNLFMATLATRGFGGVVVENSYVASQKFNHWLDEAARARELGWSASIARQDDGRLTVLTRQVPAAGQVTATLRRPLGDPQAMSLAFESAEDGSFVSVSPVPAGRWIVRLAIAADGQRMAQEAHIE